MIPRRIEDPNMSQYRDGPKDPRGCLVIIVVVILLWTFIYFI